MRTVRRPVRHSYWVVLVTMLAGGLNAVSADEIVDRIKPSPGAKHYVAFCGEKGRVGHAFVLLGTNDAQKRVCRTDLAVGFWPDGENAIERLKAVFGEVKGTLRDEMTNHGLAADSGCRLTVEVDDEDIKRLEILAGAYQAKKYRLTNRDCVTFVADAAHALGLSVPDRENLFTEWRNRLKAEIKKDVSDREALDTFPEFFVRRLAESNGQGKRAAK